MRDRLSLENSESIYLVDAPRASRASYPLPPSKHPLRTSCIRNIHVLLGYAAAILFMEDGIADQPFRITREKSVCHILLFDRNASLAHLFQNTPPTISSQETWTPACIDKDLWLQVTKRLYFYGRYPLSSIILDAIYKMKTEDELRRVLEYVTGRVSLSQLFIKMGILELDAFQNMERMERSYFDSNGIFRRVPFKPKKNCPPEFYRENQMFIHAATWKMAVEKMQPGMSLDACLQVFRDTNYALGAAAKINEHPYTDIERLIAKVNKPSFEKVPGNDTKDIDRIRVEVNLPRYMFETRKELIEAVKKARPQIDKYVVEKITSTSEFKRLGIPFSFFRLANRILRSDYVLEYIFEFVYHHDAL